MKLNRSNEPKVYTSWRMPLSEWEARLARERRSDERFKLAVCVGFLVIIFVSVALRGGL